jgi:hypothetical protein
LTPGVIATIPYSVTLDFTSLVPGGGSVVAYVVASGVALGQGQTEITGPPPFHPDYDPTFVPYSTFTSYQNSIAIAATLTAPDNVTTMELCRTTLTSGQTSISTYDFSHQLNAPTAGRLLSIQKFTAASSTYTRTPGSSYTIFVVQADGGAGGGATRPSIGNVSLGSPGGNGSRAVSKYTAAQIGASQTITVGQGGLAHVGANGDSGTGSSVGSLISCPGGIGGGALNDQVPPTINGNGNFTGVPTGGNLFIELGACQSYAMAITDVPSGMFSGSGGSSAFGNGASGNNGNAAVGPAINFGTGGAGSAINNGFGGDTAGSNGAPGVVFAYEYS